MNAKPISIAQHGLDDYLFSATQFIAPAQLGFNAKAVNIYRVMGSNLLLSSLLTRKPVGVAPVLSYKTHRLLDILAVSGLGLLSFHKAFRNDKRLLSFHLGYTALAGLHILLTDWQENQTD